MSYELTLPTGTVARHGQNGRSLGEAWCGRFEKKILHSDIQYLLSIFLITYCRASQLSPLTIDIPSSVRVRADTVVTVLYKQFNNTLETSVT